MRSLSAIILILGLTQQAFAGNTRCMPEMLDIVLTHFRHAKAGGGVIALDSRDNYKPINLGTHLEEDSVEIRDIHKDSYAVRIRLDHIDNMGTDAVLDTTVSNVNYQNCTTREPVNSVTFRLWYDN